LHAGISGFLLFGGCHGALGYAQRSTPSGLAAVMLATIPFWMVLLGTLVPTRDRRDRPGRWQLAALLPGFGGVALIAWPSQLAGQVHLGMVLLLLAAALSWAAGSIYAQSFSKGIAPIRLAGMQMLCGGGALLALAAVTREFRSFSLADVTVSSALSFAYLTFAGGTIAFTSYIWLLERLPAPIVATYTFVNPVIALVLGWFVLGEAITDRMLAGMGLVIASLAALVWLSDGPQDTKSEISPRKLPNARPLAGRDRD
jgi:drug/metabolite transporter (DMT)-like permease